MTTKSELKNLLFDVSAILMANKSAITPELLGKCRVLLNIIEEQELLTDEVIEALRGFLDAEDMLVSQGVGDKLNAMAMELASNDFILGILARAI